MAVVIGSQTQVTMTIPVIGGGVWDQFCVVSINWSYNPNIQRYYCLGSSEHPAFSVAKPTESLSVAVYTPYISSTNFDPNAGFYGVGHSEDCTAQEDQITVIVDPGLCTEQSLGYIGPISTVWYLNNYGFSKDDPNLPGQETWALVSYPTEDLDGNPTDAVAPNVVLRGIAEGQATVTYTSPYNDADPGVVFTGKDVIKSSTGNVAAGGIGRIDYVSYGVASAVGGSSNLPSQADQFGRTGQGSVSVPQTPVWY